MKDLVDWLDAAFGLDGNVLRLRPATAGGNGTTERAANFECVGRSGASAEASLESLGFHERPVLLAADFFTEAKAGAGAAEAAPHDGA